MQPVRNLASLPQAVEHELSDARAEMKPDASAISGTPCKSTASNEGKVFQPGTGDEVLVAFEHGDERMPFLTGGLWNKDAPPSSAAAAAQKAGGSGVAQPASGAVENAMGNEDNGLSDEVLNHHLRKLK